MSWCYQIDRNQVPPQPNQHQLYLRAYSTHPKIPKFHNTKSHHATVYQCLMQLTGRTSDQIMRLSESRGAMGLQAEIGTISQEGDDVRATVRVKGL